MIHCFSATGNSRYVADMLGDDIAASATDVVWVFPIHAWGVPKPVLHDIAMTDPMPGDVRHWMVATCGDDIGYADMQWRAAIEARGWIAAGAWSVLMPDTYICLPGFTVDSQHEREGKLAALPGRMQSIRRAILDRRHVVDVCRGAFPSFKSGALRHFFIKHLMSPTRFKVGEGCTGCRTCANVCPQSNIDFDGCNRPVYGNDCVMCLACLHACPHTAIEWGWFTKGKQRYKPITKI